jgi:hypothetical protein
MTIGVASFKSDLLPGDFPLEYPVTINFTNTSTTPYTAFMWKFTNAVGQISHVDSVDNPSYTVTRREQLPLTIELRIYTYAGFNTQFPDQISQTWKDGTHNTNDQAYEEWSENPWRFAPEESGWPNNDQWFNFDPNPPSGSFQYYASYRSYTHDMTETHMDEAPFVMLYGIFVGLPGGMEDALTISGAINGGYAFSGDTPAGVMVPVADMTGTVGGDASWTVKDAADYEQLSDYAGWKVLQWKIGWPYGGESSTRTGRVGPDYQWGENDLGIDFVGHPRRGWSPLGVTFTDISLTQFVEWEWSFGDGGTGTTQHPYHVYNYIWPGY